MAQKKDWKNGFEGRYTRKSSPSASPIRNPLPRGANSNLQQSPHHPLSHHSSTKCLNSYNSTYSTLSAASMLSSSTMALTSYPSSSSSGSSSLSSSISSSSSKSKSGSHLKHSVSSTSSSSNSSAGSSSAGQRTHLINSHINPPRLDNENNVNNNSAPNDGGTSWSPHARQTSTTVNFTSEELRAFRSRRAAMDGLYQSNVNRTLPSAISTPTLVQPAPYSSANDPSSLGSSSSLASATMEAPSPSTSLRASLDSLHCPRAPLASKSRGSHEVLPRTASVSDSLSNGNDSLSRSTSVTDSLCRSSSTAETSSLSRTSSICESAAPSPTVSAPMLIEGAVLARPATVTEEITIPSSPEPEFNEEAENKTSKLSRTEIEEGDCLRSSPQSISSLPNLSSPVNLPSKLSPSTQSPTVLSLTAEEEPLVDAETEPPLLPSSPPPEDDLPPPPPPPDTVTIGYGRNRRPEELECDQLSMDYVSRLGLDPRLQALLGESSAAKIMEYLLSLM